MGAKLNRLYFNALVVTAENENPCRAKYAGQLSPITLLKRPGRALSHDQRRQIVRSSWMWHGKPPPISLASPVVAAQQAGGNPAGVHPTTKRRTPARVGSNRCREARTRVGQGDAACHAHDERHA